MLHLLLAVGLAAFSGAGSDSAATHFTAMLKPDALLTNAGAANGVVDIAIRPGDLRYDLTIADLRHVTNVVVVDGEHIVNLYKGPPSPGDVLQTHGRVPARGVVGESLRQLAKDFRGGTVNIAVFTTEEPGGVLRGIAVPAPRATG